ncbi:MAG: hypothetical protein K6C36_02645 [Clostridia bacterium]|nr:hypothetical protein [Clostridia bacterium]
MNTKKIIIRVAAALVCLTMLFAFTACGQKELLVRFVDGSGNDLDLAAILGSAGNNSGTAAPAATQPAATPAATQPATPAATTPAADTPAATTPDADTPAATTPAADTPAATTPAADTPADTPAATEAPAAPASTLPTDPAGILAKYTEVMNNTKATVVTYDKLDWMQLDELDVGAITGAVKGIMDGVLKGESAAELQDNRDDHGRQIPPTNDQGIGCGLTDASAIKTASCVDNGDGTATITIVLNDETNPEPMDEASGVTTSKTGGIFNCMSQSNAVETVNGYADKIPGASLQGLDVTYKDCTVVLTFDIAANHATLIEYTVPGHVDVSIKMLMTINGKATLTNRVRINDLQY